MTEFSVPPVPAHGVTLSNEQTRRAMSLAVALDLVKGRGVQISTVRAIAQWINTGDTQ